MWGPLPPHPHCSAVTHGTIPSGATVGPSWIWAARWLLLSLSVSDDLPVFSGYLERVSAGAMGDLNAELLHVAEVA